MNAQTVELPVAKKRSEPGPTALSVKLPSDVVESARIVAALKNEAIADMLGAILRPILAKLEREEILKRSKKGGKDS